MTVVDDSNLTNLSQQVGPLNYHTTYFWRVNAKNLSGVSLYSSTRKFSTIIASPATPVLVSPANNAVNQPVALTVHWNNSLNASTYLVQVTTDSFFVSGFVKNDSTVTDTSVSVSGLVNNTRYYWRVSAKNIGGQSAWSSVYSFTTVVSLPATANLVSPAAGATINADSVLFVWNQAQPAVSQYELTFGSDSLVTSASLDTVVTDTSLLVHHVAGSQPYWWKVRAQNAAGWGPFSASRKFVHMVTGVVDGSGIPREFKLSQNYPNPFNPSTVIKYDLPASTRVRLVVYNVLGQEVQVLVDGLIEAGYHHAILNASNLSSGMYFYRIETEKFVDVKKMILLK